MTRRKSAQKQAKLWAGEILIHDGGAICRVTVGEQCPYEGDYRRIRVREVVSPRPRKGKR